MNVRRITLVTMIIAVFSLEGGCSAPAQKRIDPIVLGTLQYNFINGVQDKAGNQYDKEYEVIKKLSPKLQAMYLSYWLEVEVMNGGLEQYFWNFSDDYVKDTIKSLHMIGADEHARILKKAKNLLRQGGNEDVQLTVLSYEFITMNEDLHEARTDFMQKHHKLLLSYDNSGR